MTVNRFKRQDGRPRVAAFHGWRFPVPEERESYEEVERLAARIGADVRFFHSGIPDPAGLSPDLRQRAGRGGFFVPHNEQIHQNDLHHMRRTRPDQVATVLANLGRITGQDAEEIWARPVVRASFSIARWAQGWGADLIVARGQYEPAVHALITAYLLGVPMALSLPWLSDDSGFAVLLPLQVEVATFVWTRSHQVEETLLERFGDNIRHKLVGPECGEDAVFARFLDALSRSDSPDRLAHGASAAFCPTGAPVGRPMDVDPEHAQRARAFVILGSERTGSNLLVGLLGQQPGIACAGELFNPRDIEERNISWIHDSDADEDELLQLRSVSPDALCDRLLRDGARVGVSWVGFKLLYYHGAIEDRIVRFLVEHQDLHVIHLRRRDRLARWLSHARAEENDDWYTARRERVDAAGPRPVELDPTDTVCDFELQQLMEERFTSIFEGRRVLEIDYEDFASDLPGTGARLAAFFGCDFGELVPRSRKTGAATAREGIANFDVLLEALRGTAWEEFLHLGEQVDEAGGHGS